jgi:hypothetical protein
MAPFSQVLIFEIYYVGKYKHVKGSNQGLMVRYVFFSPAKPDRGAIFYWKKASVLIASSRCYQNTCFDAGYPFSKPIINYMVVDI